MSHPENTTTSTKAQLPTFRSVADDAVTNCDIANQGMVWAAAALRLIQGQLPPEGDAAKTLAFVTMSMDGWANDLSVAIEQIDSQLDALRNQAGEV